MAHSYLLLQAYCAMSSQFLLIFFLPLLLMLFLFRKRMKRDSKKETQKLPPGPKKLPLIGNLHQLGDLPHRSLQLLSNEFGPLMLLQLGSIRTLIVSSSDIAREIFKTHDLVVLNRPILYAAKKFSYSCFDITFTPYSDYWREIRKITVLELLSLKRVQSFRGVREEEVACVIAYIAESSSTPVNLSEMMIYLGSSVVCRAAFGKKYEAVGDSRKSRFHEIFRETLELLGGFCIADFYPWLGWINKLNGLEAKLEKNFRALDNLYDDVIAEHLDTKRPEPEHEDLVDVLLRVQKDPNQRISLTRDHIKGVLTDMYVAGTDTAAATLVWTMTELVRNPIVMKKAQDEVRRVVGKKKKVEEIDLPQLNYLKLVIKEALRLHPPAPLLVPRVATENCTIRGYEIPAETRIYTNATSIATDPKCWDNPEEFRPERFIDNPIEFRGNDFELLPFGTGRRICPGINFAVLMIELMIANLLHCFDWELPCGVKELDVEEAFGLTVHKKSPLFLVAKTASLFQNA